MRRSGFSALEGYRARRTAAYWVRAVLVLLALVCVLTSLVTSLFCAPYRVETDDMRPTLQAGDRLLALPAPLPFTFSRGSALPLRRGSLVVVNTGRGEQPRFPLNIALFLADKAARFFTLQRVSLLPAGGRLHIKRVIGLPGDEVSMTNFVVRVKTRGSDYRLTEFEVRQRKYDILTPSLPAGWNGSLPFSGNMEPVTVGEGQCFLLSDDRSSVADSRYWGAVPLTRVKGIVFLRHWPFPRFVFF
jgi:signal peptidase I